MGALNIPSAADVERLTPAAQLQVSQRMEGIEEAVNRLDQRLAAMSQSSLDDRLAGIEGQLSASSRSRSAHGGRARRRSDSARASRSG